MLPEDFVHYIWKFRLFAHQRLFSADGQEITVLSTGSHNFHAGPDFENSLIRIGETLWAGNVEIHLLSSDWLKHNHQTDQAYDNVILHVVWQHDQDICRTDGTRLPVLELQTRTSPALVDKYLELTRGLDWIPCQGRIASVDPYVIRNWLYRTGIERLEQKSDAVIKSVAAHKGSWDDAFYIALARNFGFKVNALPFEMLARSLPRQVLARYRGRPDQIEALVFGQAGLLTKHRDEYPKKLSAEYDFLRRKHGLKEMHSYIWKFMRLRPRNFPTIRLAQFAALLSLTGHLFSRILEECDVSAIISHFKDLPVNPYWENHYRFDAESPTYRTDLGEQSLNNIMINTVAPFLMAFGRSQGAEEHVGRAISLQEKTGSEINSIIKRFKKIGVPSDNAFFSQALIQLKKAYCDQKKCVSCGIGVKLLNN